MSIFPDLRPRYDGLSNLGKMTHRWRIVYAMNLSDGTVTVPVSDIATKADLAAASTLPAVTSADNGRFMGVEKGRWTKVAAPPGVLPVVSAADNDKYLTVYNGVWRAMKVLLLPAVTQADNGKVLRVVDGAWEKYLPPPLLPNVTEQDDGKILQVLGGSWRPALPPSDVLPPVSVADHGSLLTVLHGVWGKHRLEQANLLSDGLIPRLPGSPGRVLAGNNTWAAAPTGASGQWRIGDIRMTRAAPGYGWIATNGGAIPFDPAYKALYLVLGGDEAGWAANTPVALPNIPDACIRYLPDAQAAAEFGILLDVEGSDAAGARLHFELALYREPTPLAPVVTMDTFHKATPVINFTAALVDTTSSAPGWFWHDRDRDLWRLFSSSGEEARPADRAQVLVDLAEIHPAAIQNDRLTPGSYYYRYRQIIQRGDTRTPGVWRWGRILSTGGMSDESTQLVKLCDVFSRVGPQWWTLPRSSARLFLVSSRGMVEEGSGLTADTDCRVLVDEGSARGARLTVLGQGYQQRGNAGVGALDFFGVMPQYTCTAVRTGTVSFTEAPLGSGNAYGWVRTLAFNSTTGRAANPDCVLGVSASGNAAHNVLVDMTTLDARFNRAFSSPGDWQQALGVGAFSGADGEYDYVVPPVTSLTPQKIRLGGGQPAAVLVADGVNKWSAPYFLHAFHVAGHDYYIPGEAPGIWDGENQRLIPFPDGTVFKGSRAASLGGDGCIYCMPRYTWSDTLNTTSTGILRFDPVTKAIDFIAVPWALVIEKGDGWLKAVPLRDGRVLFVPYGDGYFVIVDPAKGTLGYGGFGSALPAGPKWGNAWVMSDGTVCGFGTDAAHYGTLCFRFDPDRDKATLFTFPAVLDSSIRCGTPLPDGGILLFPGAGPSQAKLFVATMGAMPYSPCTASPLINMP